MARSRSPAPVRACAEAAVALTAQQREICRCVLAGESFRIVANAGTGKTATALWAAAPLRKRVLLLAYNRDIRLEVQLQVQRRGLEHISVENYDSLLLNFYDGNAASQDFQLSLQQVLDADTRPLRSIAWDLVFIDEGQDLDGVYLRFLNKVLRDNVVQRSEVQVVSVGDPKQTIFRYRGADANIFMCGGEPFAHLHPVGTKTLKLTESFRFGPGICAFVNRVCSPLFESFLSHRSPSVEAGNAVEHWILAPLARARGSAAGTEGAPTALIARLLELHAELRSRAGASAEGAPEHRLLAFLSGSKKESNEGLWSFIEALALPGEAGSGADRAARLVVDDPAVEPVDGPALAFLRNIHSCKGKSFEVAVLFVTTRRSWLGPDGVEAEVLYVALTRAKRLLVVEAAESLIFQEVLHAISAAAQHSAGAFGSPPRCATTGATLALPLRRAPRAAAAQRTSCRSSVSEQVGKFGVQAKLQLLELIEAPELHEMQGRCGGEGDASAAALLLSIAAWLRLERDEDDEDELFKVFFLGLKQRQPVEEIYMRLRQRTAAVALAPPLQTRLEDLARHSEELSALDFLESARFHPVFHYGFLALAEISQGQLRTFEVLHQRLVAELRRLQRPQRLRELKAGCSFSGASSPASQPGGGSLFLTADERLVLVKAETVQAEGLQDRLLAAYAAAKMGMTTYEIVYVPLEEELSVERVQGQLPAANAGRYVELFERACSSR